MIKWGIEGKLLRWFLFIALVPILIIGLFGIQHLRETLWADLQREIARDITEREISIGNLANSYQQRLDIFASNLFIQHRLIAFNRLNDQAREILEKDDLRLKGEIDEFLGAAGFVAICITGKNGGKLYQSRDRSLQSFFSQAQHLKDDSEDGPIQFIRGTDNQPYLVVQGTVIQRSESFSDDEPIGMITLVSKIDEVEDVISASKWPIFLFNHKKEAILNFPMEADQNLLSGQAIEEGVSGETGMIDVGSYLVTFRHLEETEGALVTLIDKEEVFRPISKMTYFFGVGGLVTFGVVIFISSGASRKLVQPLRHLLRGVEEVTAGNLEATVQIASGDEVESLGNRFNEMIDKVRGRTKDLSDFKYALDQSSIVSISSHKGTIQYVNDLFCEVSQFSREELIGQDHAILSSGSHSKTYIRNMWSTIASGKVWRGHFKNKAKDGSIYWVDTTIVPFLDDQGFPYQYLAIRIDITKHKAAEDRVRLLAQYDELTRLPNRALFNERLHQTIDRQSWRRRSFAVMFLDLDRFKLVNDTLGHSAGDELLQQVSERLTACLREGDTVARMGGDEFTILLPSIAKNEDAFFVAQKVVDALKKPFRVVEKELLVTGSIGVSLYPDNGEDAETLLKNADAAMYRAKESGRGRFNFYVPVTSDGNSKMDMMAALSHAIEREELLLQYQPLVDLKQGKMIGMESLIRWMRQGPEDEVAVMVSPAEFIPLAEESGLILSIGDWVLRTAISQLKYWQESGFVGLCVSVNVAALQFQEEDFVEVLEQMLEETGIDPGSLKLELTESLLMKNQDRVIPRLEAIKALGVRLAIDDFGTGYSSLSYLKRFPVDTLKIDQSFVRNILEDADDAAIAEMILSLAAHLKMEVVAEGIETQAQLEFVKKRGCQTGQGYLFSRPVSADAMTALLMKTRESDSICSISPDAPNNNVLPKATSSQGVDI